MIRKNPETGKFEFDEDGFINFCCNLLLVGGAVVAAVVTNWILIPEAIK